MGWTFFHREPGQTTREVMQKEYSRGKILEFAMVGSVGYGAYQPEENGPVMGLVVLTERASGYHNFGYKDMTEDMGPYEAKAPAKVLDALSPVEEAHGEGTSQAQYAAEWRAACRERLAKMAAKPKVKPGQKVRFAEAIEFTSGAKLQELEYEKGSTFRVGYCRYRVTGWKEMDYELVK